MPFRKGTTSSRQAYLGADLVAQRKALIAVSLKVMFEALVHGHTSCCKGGVDEL